MLENTKDIYNISEAAKHLGVSRRTLHRYIKKGLISPRKSFSGLPYFRSIDIEFYKIMLQEEKTNNGE